jgi:hypothetical protein
MDAIMMVTRPGYDRFLDEQNRTGVAGAHVSGED